MVNTWNTLTGYYTYIERMTQYYINKGYTKNEAAAMADSDYNNI